MSRPSFARRLFSFLSTMDLAITLLLTLAIASIIGTVLQQNQPYPDYLLKFGPFWFDVFESLGLYDVYSAAWFLLILVLLVVSTSVCVFRNAPTMVREIWQLRTQVQAKSLRAMQHHEQWTQSSDVETLTAQAQAYFTQQGFRNKVVARPEAGETLISAMKGGMNRMGYLLTHLAIIVICLGALLDSNVPMKLAKWQGNLQVETRDLSISKVPQESRLAVGNHAFRGSISIPEGKSASVAFIGLEDGYVMQELPFKIAVKDFRIAHYATGQPKSFESDLVITDPELESPLEQTISVNHPLSYRGYTIYQASFADGGSLLTLKPWALSQEIGPFDTAFNTKVFDKQATAWGSNAAQLEITNFRVFNINPDPTDDEPGNMRNFGPTINFKIRSKTGEAREYENYMLPVPRDGRDYFFSGVRENPNETFRYLYLPMDDNGSVAEWVAFVGALQDTELVDMIAAEMATITLSDVTTEKDILQKNLHNSLAALVELFLRGGFSEVGRFIEASLPEADREALGAAYLAMLREMLGRVYIHTLDQPAIQTITDLNDEQVFFLQDAVTAVGALPLYGAPVYLELTDYTHIQATGLQIAHMPGKPIVYLGCAMLIIGVFLLFYLPQRRFWLILKPEQNGCNLLFAGMSNRNPYEFDSFFDQTYQQLKQAVEGNFDPEKRSESMT